VSSRGECGAQALAVNRIVVDDENSHLGTSGIRLSFSGGFWTFQEALNHRAVARWTVLALVDILDQPQAKDLQGRELLLDRPESDSQTIGDPLTNLALRQLLDLEEGANVVEREAQLLAAPDEPQAFQGLQVVDPVPGGSSTRARQEPHPLIEAQSVSRKAATDRQVTDFETLVNTLRHIFS
jgi:hypothetical protein